jgi:hypothetical protein
MNLHGIASGVVGVVNPPVAATILRSTGYNIAPDGRQLPQYETIGNVMVQMQALSTDDLRQVEGLNIQGNKQAVYLDGQWNGVVRVAQQGGDLFRLGGISGTWWLAAIVLENWPDWTKLALIEQVAPPVASAAADYLMVL